MGAGLGADADAGAGAGGDGGANGLRVECVGSIAAVSASEWNHLAGPNPTLSHAYLLAMEEAGCAVPRFGWQGAYIVAREQGGGPLRGALPLYFKGNSWGEFVFDWEWAAAYERHGLEYYPKLVSAVPFTPVTGRRLLAESAEVRAALVAGALALAKEAGVSSLHFLFPLESEARELEALGFFLRKQVQFHWENSGFRDFEAFVASMKREKRKSLLRDRRQVREAGVTFERRTGAEIRAEDWEFFAGCYRAVHEQHGSPASLNRDFFRRLGASLADHCLLVIASRGGERIASALNLIDGDTLYGRSWGTHEFVPGLHFETCYYQAIDFCLERGLRRFEGGAQGEHKLARGLLPTETFSAHWLARPEFARAVREHVRRESGEIDRYVRELGDHSPFKAR